MQAFTSFLSSSRAWMNLFVVSTVLNRQAGVCSQPTLRFLNHSSVYLLLSIYSCMWECVCMYSFCSTFTVAMRLTFLDPYSCMWHMVFFTLFCCFHRYCGLILDSDQGPNFPLMVCAGLSSCLLTTINSNSVCSRAGGLFLFVWVSDGNSLGGWNYLVVDRNFILYLIGYVWRTVEKKRGFKVHTVISRLGWNKSE